MSSEEQIGSKDGQRAASCEEAMRLRDALLIAIRELSALHTDLMQAVIDEDPEFSRFDLLVHMANEKKDNAKYALLQHLDFHRCQEV